MPTFLCLAGREDVFGEDIRETPGVGKSLYCVRALSYCDINKIEIHDLTEIMRTYPEFAERFLTTFNVTFNLKHVSLTFKYI